MNVSRRHFVELAIGASVCLSARARDGINTVGFVPIGGIDQWIAIQGRDVHNPPILFLHGGPGEAQSPFLKEFVSWERYFVVANWDQRGSGKTFGRNGSATPNMTLNRLIEDAIEVAERVRARLSRQKLILVGHSWGSFLGVNIVKRRPDLFCAFVGTGQVVSFAASAENRVDWARQQAIAVGDTETLEAIQKAEESPLAERAMAELAASAKYRLSPSDSLYVKIEYEFMQHAGGLSTSSMTDLSNLRNAAKGAAADWIAGAEFSGSKLEAIVKTMNIRELGLEIGIPFFVIQGRDDHITSYEAARKYVDEIHAPAKAFIPIDGGHFACFTNAEQFADVMNKRISSFAK